VGGVRRVFGNINIGMDIGIWRREGWMRKGQGWMRRMD
jgi:hypothetical protein